MMNPAPAAEPPLRPNPAPAYESPAIIHKTHLKHFSGSPLAVDPGASDNLLGLPQ